MKDSLFYKKNKREGFRLTLFVFIAVLAIVAILPFSLAQDRDETDEKKLSSIFPNIYATLMDKDGKIISTTDATKEVDALYQNSGTTHAKYITLTDNMYLYLDGAEVVSEELVGQITDDEYYYLDIPSYIVPDPQIIITSPDQEKELFNMGKVKGYGGIYNENGKNRLKIRFQEMQNSYSVKFSYQFSLKLSDTIYDQTPELKVITIEDVGDIMFYMKDIEEPEVSNYVVTQTVAKKGVSYDISTLTTTLTDDRSAENRSTNGKMVISLGSDFGFDSSAQKDYLNAIKIYVDDEELTKGTSTSKETTFSNDNIKIVATATATTDLETQCTDDANSCLVKELEFLITGKNSQTVSGVHEIKIVLDEKLVTTKYRDHVNTAKFVDYLDNNKETSDSAKDGDYKLSPYLNSSLNNMQYDVDNYVPQSYTNYINLPTVASNYITYNISTSMFSSSYDNFGYFFDSTCFVYDDTHNTCGNKLRINIDGTQVAFTNHGLLFSNLYDRSTVSTDPMVYMQMKEVLGSDFNSLKQATNPTYLWQSDEPNADGEYYYVVLSYNTYNYAKNGISSGRNEYAEIPSSNGIISSVPAIKMHIFNVSNHAVNMYFDYDLSTILRADNRTYKSGYTSMTVSANYDGNTTRTEYPYNSFSSKRYVATSSETLNSLYTKWETIVDTREIDKYDAQDILFYLRGIDNYFNISTDYYYSIPDRMMVNAARTTGQTLGTDYLTTSKLYVGHYNAEKNRCDGSYSPLTLTALTSSDYKGLLSGTVYKATKGSTDLPKVDNKLCFVYFTSSDYNNSSVHFEMDVKGQSHISNAGNDALNVIYVSKGSTISLSGSGKSLYETTPGTATTTINKWSYSFTDYYSSYSTCYNRTAVLPYNCTNALPNYHRGVFQFYDKMVGDLAKYTTLKSITVKIRDYDNSSTYHTITMSSTELANLDNKKCDGDICLNISYPANSCDPNRTDTSCLTTSYGANYLNTLSKMDNGFSFMLTGASDTQYVEITYETETDDAAAINELNKYNQELMTYNYIYNNPFTYMEPYESYDSSYQASSDYFIRKYAAGVAISKELKETTKTFLTKDTDRYVVEALVGQTALSYLDLSDVLKSYNFGGDSYNTNEDLQEYIKYLDPQGLKIKYSPNSMPKEEDLVTIYEEGEFVGNEWLNSTISFDKTNNDFYTIHFVRNGEDNNMIPAGATFIIEYGLVFDIDSDTLGSYRPNDKYLGGGANISTDVEAIIPNDSSFTSIEPAITSNNKNYIDNTAGKVHCFLDEEVEGAYLEPAKLFKSAKSITSGDVEVVNYAISRVTKSAGKPLKPTFTYADALKFDLSTVPSASRAEFERLLIKYMTISNVAIKDVTYSEQYDQVTVGSATFSYTEPIAFDGNTIEYPYGTFSIAVSDNMVMLSLVGELPAYDRNFAFTYDVSLNKKAFIEEATSLGLIDSSMKIAGTNTVFTLYENNSVYSAANLLTPLTSASSGRIGFNNLTPSVQKTVAYPSTLEQTWTVKTNTDRAIKITDIATVNGDQAIKDNVSIQNISIKIGGVMVYENETFKDSYGDYITINVDGLKVIFNFTDDAFSANGSAVEIKYNTVLDKDAYYEATHKASGQYTISNVASIERGGLAASSTTTTRQIPFNYPLTTSKTFVGNGVNLAITNWRIEAFAEELAKENIIIKDTVTLDDDSVGTYLSISDMAIKIIDGTNETVIFDLKNNVNELEDNHITITDKNSEVLDFNNNGEYEFIVNVDKLEKNKKLVVDYQLKIDEDQYNSDNKETDVRLNIHNKAVITSNEEEYTKEDDGFSVVETQLKKEFKVVSINDNEALLTWNINVNLDVTHKDRLTNEDTVKIIDELFDSLEYVDGTLKIYGRISEGTINAERLLQLDEDYEFTYDDNTITIRLLKPKDTSIVNIEFNTTCSSTEGLKNYVALQINDETTYTKSPDMPPLFLKYIGGTIISRQTAQYTIYAKKYYNGELASKRFKFNLKEVDILGEPIPNGLDITAYNDENGDISFGSFKFYQTGVHFYKITEVNEQEPNVEYDDKSYTVMLSIEEYNNAYLVNKAIILRGQTQEGEIIFNNIGGETTVEVTKTWDDENDQDGKRSSLDAKVQLYKSVDGAAPTKVTGDQYLVDVPTENGTVVRWEHLPVYEDGKLITYSVVEEYDGSIGYRVDNGTPVEAEIDKVKTITLTNSYAREQTTIEVKKTWDDNNNAAGKRADLKAKVQLYKSVNGQAPTKVEGNDYLVDVPTTNGIIATWEHLPVYENGKVITYSVVEEFDNTIGYEADNGVAVVAEKDKTGSISVTNTYTKEDPPFVPDEPEPKPQDEPEPPEEEKIIDEETVVPKTGDMIIYSVIAAVLSMGVLAVILVYLKKRKRA